MMRRCQVWMLLSKIGVTVITVTWIFHWLFLYSADQSEELEPWPPPHPVAHRRLSNESPAITISPHVHIYNLSIPVDAIIRPETCPITDTVPSFHICVYEPHRDRYISAALLTKDNAVWEPYITSLFQRALSDYPNAAVIDIGANIGYYSFLAASMGHHVIAIEPGQENIQKLQQGAQMNKLDILILHNAVYDRHINVGMSINKDNQGGIWMKKVGKDDKHIVQTITMNDIIPLIDSHQAILKIDIEGFECRMFTNIDQLFTKVYIPFIFMEWNKMYKSLQSDKTPCSHNRVQQVASKLNHLGYSAYEVRTGFELDTLRATAWRIGDVYWRHHTANLIQQPY